MLDRWSVDGVLRPGLLAGRRRTRRAITRFGQIRLWRWKMRFVSTEEYERRCASFSGGGVIVLVARLMPLVHSVVSIRRGDPDAVFPFMLYTILARFCGSRR